MKYIRVKYIGLQHTPHRGSFKLYKFKLYNLLEPMNEHPVHSTVSLSTIHANGFEPIEQEGL